MNLLKPGEMPALDGATLVLHEAADETEPQRIVFEVRHTDGLWFAQMGDGSVQQLTSQRYLALGYGTGQSNPPPKAVQPRFPPFPANSLNAPRP